MAGVRTKVVKRHHIAPTRDAWWMHATAMPLTLLLLLFVVPTVNPQEDDIGVDASEVKNWALEFGKIISEGSAEATCMKKIKESFLEHGAKVEWVEIPQMLEKMRLDLKNMLHWKTEAVKKIAEVAQAAASNRQIDDTLKFEYYNAKKLYDSDDEPVKKDGWRKLEMSTHHNFEVPVNTMHSSIHVPTNVYDKGSKLVNAVKWTEALNRMFRNNLASDPSIYWQYFCSETGFLRMFPGSKWPENIEAEDDLDFYDCRMRSWYIQAAASAKDIVILIDNSGSMTGIRREIANNVAITILDTLTENDFVTVMRFSSDAHPLVPCFGDSMVQATARNVREFKDHLSDNDTAEIANFTRSLSKAFELLHKYNRSGLGSQCNQAIMLVTDGAPEKFEEIFRKYNWPDSPVRVFTYLVGIEVTEISEVNFMACQNRGYFTHVASLTEVQEEVQKYIPVMSRPIMLSGTQIPIWTGVYADVPDVYITRRLWKNKYEDELEEIYLKKLEWLKTHVVDEDKTVVLETGVIAVEADDDDDKTPSAEDDDDDYDDDDDDDDDHAKKKPQLLTTVAVPVLDKSNTSAQQGKLLGVAGVDVPVEEFMKLTPAYKLGVNGYSFAITNNGYVLYHPDLRPRFGEFLKPDYTNVDLAEVELVAQEKKSPWDHDEKLLAMRKTMIDREIGSNRLEVKIHLDNMRRVATRNNVYYYGPIENTPFSLAISVPEPYGHYRVMGQNNVTSLKEDWMEYFRGNNWRVHPEWVYCDLGNKSENLTPEQVIKKFLTEILSTQQFRWRGTSDFPVVIQNSPMCEEDLIQSLVFDAKVTNIDTKKCASPKLPSKYETSVIKMNGVMTTFVATRSGLLRVEDHLSEEERANITEKPFKDVHTRAIDELFYRRAVDFYTVNSSAFVFSVPHDAANRKHVRVIGSHAIFLGSGKKMAPAAVVGLEFDHTMFSQQFNVTTSRCIQNCRFTCDDEELDCYLLDNNGFVVVSENHKQTGKFFGEIDSALFDSMIKSGIYKRVHLYDYQAICIEPDKSKNTADFLLTPFHHLRNVLSWMWSKLAMFLVNYSLYGLWSHDGIFSSGFSFVYTGQNDVLEETTFRTCEKEVHLYEMQTRDSDDPIKGRIPVCHQTGCHKQFIVQYVPYTNLLMLVVSTSCRCETTSVSLTAESYEPNTTLQCNHMKNGLYRERPILCVNYHEGEKEIQDCGKGSSLSSSIFLSLIAFVLSRHVLI